MTVEGSSHMRRAFLGLIFLQIVYNSLYATLSCFLKRLTRTRSVEGIIRSMSSFLIGISTGHRNFLNLHYFLRNSFFLVWDFF